MDEWVLDPPRFQICYMFHKSVGWYPNWFSYFFRSETTNEVFVMAHHMTCFFPPLAVHVWFCWRSRQYPSGKASYHLFTSFISTHINYKSMCSPSYKPISLGFVAPCCDESWPQRPFCSERNDALQVGDDSDIECLEWCREAAVAQWNLSSQKRWTVVCKLKQQVSTNHRLFNL